MSNPVFLLCGGRTGGTVLADILAQLPGMSLLIEPMHPDVPRLATMNPRHTPAILKHHIRPHHMRGYAHMPQKCLRELHGARDKDPEAYFRFLVEEARGRPTIKVCRMYGRRHLLREWFPDAKFIHLWRGAAAQLHSMKLCGMPPNYFGMLSAARSLFESSPEPQRQLYMGRDLAPALFQFAWQLAVEEANDLADLTLNWSRLLDTPTYELGKAAVLLGFPPELGADLAHLVVRPH